MTRDGKTVPLSSLKLQAEERVRTTRGDWVEARRFQFLEEPEDHEAVPKRQASTDISTDIDAGPQHVPDPERHLFLSYARGDDTPEGKKRAAAVDRLHQALVNDGFRVVRDRDAMVPGDSIRDFMERLAGGAQVICVISEKYLRSAYCMHELYRIYQRCGSDRRELAERIVPVILPEVKIGDLRERKPYLKFWSREHQELEATFRDPDLRPGPESLREVHRVRDFANHVDDILVFVNDILMPRNLGEDDDFEPVRELLRKRLG